MPKRALVAVVLSSLLLVAGLVGCVSASQADDSSANPEKTLVVGCDVYPPYVYNDEEGTPIGIDAEIIDEAAKRIGMRAQCVYIDWEDKEKLLASGDIDCVMSSFTMTGREDQFKWAGPYMRSRQIVAVSPESDIKTLADLKGKVIGTQSTTKPEAIILDKLNKDVPEVWSIFSFSDRAFLGPALLKGYVDAIAAHETSVLQYEKDYGVDLRILDEPLMEVGLGVAFDLNDDRGIDRDLSRVLGEMRRDGTTGSIISKYLGGDASPYLNLEGLNA